MERHMYRAAVIAGATAGVALGFLKWAAYLVGILPYQTYILTAGIILPVNLAFTIQGYLIGFLVHTAFTGLWGVLFALLVRDRLSEAISWGIGFGIMTMVLLAGFLMGYFTPEQPFWNLNQAAQYFTIISSILYGAFLGYLYRQFLRLPAGVHR
ncbi:MAG: hypothetical protein SCK29_04070 [Bacillota bacterium]|nr:hypothetical protein [Bacillota bacterium]